MAESVVSDRGARLVYSPKYLEYGFGGDHPMSPIRLSLAVDLMRQAGLLQEAGELIEPRFALDHELAAVHRPDYIEMVKSVTPESRFATLASECGLGTDDNPLFDGMHEAASLIAGGTLRAVEMVMSGEAQHAFNIAGGLHHALESAASGFCIYNDVAVAIAAMRRTYGARVMYVDFDVHHGDGVQAAFYSDPAVLTLSFHETGRYLFPGTGGVEEIGWGDGRGYSVNIPLQPFTDDESWLEAVEDLVPLLARTYRPDIIISQHGCDAHVLDPMAHLNLTMRAIEKAATVAHDAAHTWSGGRWVAVGGGGYNVWSVVPRALAAVWAAMSDRSLPASIPLSWREKWQQLSPEELPREFHDCASRLRPVARRDQIVAANRHTVARLKHNVLPLLVNQFS